MVRGSGKFKTKRGGGRSFSRDMDLDQNGIAVSRATLRKKQDDSDDKDEDEDALQEEEEEDDDDEEEDEEENAADSSAAPQPGLTRTERRELKKKQAAEKQAQKQGIDEDDEDADLINPNHVEKKLTISDLGSIQLTRKEREVKEKQEAKDRYWKLHLAGQTDEAKSDLARLKKIKEEREAAQAKRKAEAEAKATEIEAKKASMAGKRI
ncbi:casein kinase substrate phosphoprotein PP28-domain-containing protein [Boletus edulis BED1]|uniref:Casein kinase substrate phosphoprotein PP28-domain-containing protein n=1 Tax=Boletus edulis BED1 TaxID=1328754 RepID=A0AAD4BRX9_BOLED|nr:casein kinase substrate phosphoprotein PP28-domain-containing protein [Boletus edulis BED1]